MLNLRKSSSLANRGILLAALLGIGLPSWSVAAHETALEVSGGAVAFTEDTEPFWSGAARFYVTPRISLGPEVTFIQGDDHNHWVATGNVTFDFIDKQSGRNFMPFAVVGGGVFQTRETFQNQTFTSREGAFTGGVGFRFLVGERITLGADVRIGWEPHIRVGGTLGFRLGK